jgi:hypothetical protein
MEEEKKVEAAQQSRRAFVKTAAQVAVTAPAVAMLLSATTKPAAAQAAYGLTSIDDAGGNNDICGVPLSGGADQTNCPPT